MMILKIKFGCDFAVGTDGYRYVKIDDDSTPGYIDEISDEYALQNFESYSYLRSDDGSEIEDNSYWYDYEIVDSIPEGEKFEDLTSNA
jgi:hypothetical protein